MIKLDELKEAVNDRCVFGWRDVKRLIERVEELERINRDMSDTNKEILETSESKLQLYHKLAERIVKYLPDVQQQLHRLGYETVAVEVSMHIAEARELLKED